MEQDTDDDNANAIDEASIHHKDKALQDVDMVEDTPHHNDASPVIKSGQDKK